jgi:hypothetical protein
MSDAAGETLKSASQRVSPFNLHRKLISRQKHPSGAAEDYMYEEIRALTEIRLLHILPGIGHGIISCKLLPYNVSLRIDQATCGSKNQVQYTVLSYTWGDPKLACSVLINGANLRITINLHTALLHLRDPVDTKVIWADAICINQSSLEERSQQVTLMALINKNASLTVVWLGKESNDSALALECLGKSLSNKFDIEEVPSTSAEFQAVESIFARPWWNRMWVLQEVCLACSVTFMCGRSAIPWEALSKGMLNLTEGDFNGRAHNKGLGIRRKGEEGKYPKYLLKGSGERQFQDTFFPMRKPNERLLKMSNKVDEIAMWKEKRECKSLELYGGSTLDALLQHYASRDATDPRDKVYALLSS